MVFNTEEPLLNAVISNCRIENKKARMDIDYRM